MSGLEINNYSYNIKEIRHVQFSPNDKLILSTCWDAITEIFDISSNKNALTLPKDTLGAHFSTLSSDGKLRVRCNMNNSLELYEISSGKVIQIFDGHQNTITSMALSPDGEMLLTSSFDETVRLFNVSSGLKLLEIPIENFDGNEVAVFSSNGKSILIGEGEFDSNNFRWKWYSPFQLYNLTTGKKIGTNASYIYGASFSSNRTFLISYGNTNSACVYDILSSNEIQCFSYPNLIISSVELSHDGNLALIGYENGMTKTFDVSSGKEIQIIKNK